MDRNKEKLYVRQRVFTRRVQYVLVMNLNQKKVHNVIVDQLVFCAGSGKRALLEVVSRRSRGPTRGQILLDGAPMTLSLFQRSCGYVSHRTDLLPSLSVEQTLHYSANLSIGSQVQYFLIIQKSEFEMISNLRYGRFTIFKTYVAYFIRLNWSEFYQEVQYVYGCWLYISLKKFDLKKVYIFSTVQNCFF